MPSSNSSVAGNERNFIMFHMGRCGSTVLQSLLQEAGGILHDGEAFEVLYKRRKEANPDLTPEKFLRARQDHAAKRGLLYGCEIKYPKGTQLDWIDIPLDQSQQFFEGLGFRRFILLSRANLLDRVISQRVAMKRGAYIRKAGDTTETGSLRIPLRNLGMGRFNSDLLGLLTQLDQDTQAMRSCLRAAVPDFLELTYETDVLKDPNQGARKLADYVGMDYADISPPQAKVVTRTKPELVENYDEIIATLTGTQFEWMLRDEKEQ